jgi:hypothetical protein
MRAIKHILFFGLRQDLLPVLHEVECALPLTYTQTGRFLNKSFSSFDQASQIPNLGLATTDSVVNCDTFLVARRHTPIVLRSVSEISAGETFRIDQMLNPDTVAIKPGGARGEEVVLHGRVASISDSQPSQSLMGLFLSAFRKHHFQKIKAFWVGPEAFALLKAGKRLTMSVQSPRDFDLAI